MNVPLEIRRVRRSMVLFPVLGLILFATAASAGGRVELSQASIEASGGFPFRTTTPGSFVLTSDLVVSTDVSALVLDFQRPATLDLNGFGIYGPGGCSAGACPSGAAVGIDARRASISVHGGTVHGFSGSCVEVGVASHVEGLTVSECGANGIDLFPESVAIGNRVRDVGAVGLLLRETSVAAENTVLQAGLSLAGAAAIEGGTATAPNVCDDGSCSMRGARRYYLTPGSVTGADALSACADGYHLASIWEVAEVSILEYDTRRGYQEDDSGTGPPASADALGSPTPGWVRNGTPSNDSSVMGNCNAWTTPSGSADGTQARLARPEEAVVPAVENTFATGTSWLVSGGSCATPARAWCIED